MLDGEKVIYIKTANISGIAMEFWYSYKYNAPLKYKAINIYEDGTISEINWILTSIIESEVDANIFEIDSNGTMTNGNEDDYYKGNNI